MSHLSTLIRRVKSGEDHGYGPVFEQAVINLMEYIILWDDHTKSEKFEAIQLYDLHRGKLTGKTMPSHLNRLVKTDEIRAGLG